MKVAEVTRRRVILSTGPRMCTVISLGEKLPTEIPAETKLVTCTDLDAAQDTMPLRISIYKEHHDVAT